MKNRKLNRLPGFDYSNPGAYFVTLCIHRRFENATMFGEVINNEMVLNEKGKISSRFWSEIPEHYPNVELGEWVIMPDHIHGIIVLLPTVGTEPAIPVGTEPIIPVGTEHCSVPTGMGSGTANSKNYGQLSKIIKSFKNIVTSNIRKLGDDEFMWQRSFHDRIIRNQDEWAKISWYIRNNPTQFNTDRMSREIAC